MNPLRLLCFHFEIVTVLLHNVDFIVILTNLEKNKDVERDHLYTNQS